jgi:hypothetical protein
MPQETENVLDKFGLWAVGGISVREFQAHERRCGELREAIAAFRKMIEGNQPVPGAATQIPPTTGLCVCTRGIRIVYTYAARPKSPFSTVELGSGASHLWFSPGGRGTKRQPSKRHCASARLNN